MKDLSSLERYRLRDAELKLYGVNGDSGNGCFKVYIGGRSFFCIVSNGGGWDHVSVSPCNRRRRTCPTWEEMCAIKDLFFEDEEAVIQYHPKKSQYVNFSECCLHLWRPTGEALPTPPVGYV